MPASPSDADEVVALKADLAEAVRLLRATTACIGTIEDDNHWKARDEAEAFLVKFDAI